MHAILVSLSFSPSRCQRFTSCRILKHTNASMLWGKTYFDEAKQVVGMLSLCKWCQRNFHSLSWNAFSFSLHCIAYALSSADFGAHIISSFISLAIYSSVEIKQFLGQKKAKNNLTATSFDVKQASTLWCVNAAQLPAVSVHQYKNALHFHHWISIKFICVEIYAWWI